MPLNIGVSHTSKGGLSTRLEVSNMSIRVTCSKCATGMSVPDKYAGKTLKCLKCGAPFHVPQQTPAETPSEPSSDRRPARAEMNAPKFDTLASRVKWKIGGDIRNKAVLEYIANNVDPDEEIVATLLGLGEKTSIGALFGEQAGAALGGSYLLVTDKKVVIIKSGVGTWGTGSFGVKTKTFLYDHIASVDVSKQSQQAGACISGSIWNALTAKAVGGR